MCPARLQLRHRGRGGQHPRRRGAHPAHHRGPAEDSSDLYRRADAVVKALVADKEVYEKDEKMRTVSLTEAGSEKVEAMLGEAGLLEEGNLYVTKVGFAEE